MKCRWSWGANRSPLALHASVLCYSATVNRFRIDDEPSPLLINPILQHRSIIIQSIFHRSIDFVDCRKSHHREQLAMMALFNGPNRLSHISISSSFVTFPRSSNCFLLLASSWLMNNLTMLLVLYVGPIIRFLVQKSEQVKREIHVFEVGL